MAVGTGSETCFAGTGTALVTAPDGLSRLEPTGGGSPVRLHILPLLKFLGVGSHGMSFDVTAASQGKQGSHSGKSRRKDDHDDESCV